MLTRPTDWPADPGLRGLFPALAPQRMLGVFRDRLGDEAVERRRTWNACRVIEALYDPADQIRVVYVLSPDDALPPQRAWPEGDLVYVRHPVRVPMSRRGMVLDAGGLEVEAYRFPNDRRLRGLRKFARRESAAATWQRWLGEDEPAVDLEPGTLRRTLMRYVPEQKWIVHLRAGCYDAVAEGPGKRAVAVRSADVETCRRIYARTVQMRRTLADVPEAFRVPRPVALDDALGLLAVQWVWGRSLVETLAASGDGDLLNRVAAGLNALHRASVPDLLRVTAEDQLASVDGAARDLALVMPSLEPALRSVTATLAGTRPSADGTAPRTLHNDFHWNQLRIKRDRITVLDLDRCAVGDPWIDVATFTTQLAMLGPRDDVEVSASRSGEWSRAFLAAWESIAGLTLDLPRVRWYSVVALLTLARGMMRHLRPGWPTTVHQCVERALLLCRESEGLEGVA